MYRDVKVYTDSLVFEIPPVHSNLSQFSLVFSWYNPPF